MSSQKCALLILDGWGLGPYPERDAIQMASTPFFDQLMAQYPHSQLVTYGQDVGLPDGQMGNSEVGHLNIGAGRIVYQDFARINRAIANGDLAKNDVLKDEIDQAIKRHSQVHFFGLLSDGGVHSHTAHLRALIDIAEARGAKDVFVHAFLDGRDTDPNAGLRYVSELQEYLQSRTTRLVSVIGRYFAMDRDNRWERIKLAYDLLVRGVGRQTHDVVEEIQKCYDQGVSDEFMPAISIRKHTDELQPTLDAGDLAICFNFRTDRPRQISEVLTQRDLREFEMARLDLSYVTMTTYDSEFSGVRVLFEKDNLEDTIGEVLSDAGKSQLRMAETEKYPHVTYFLSGGREAPFEGEERIVIPSPKVDTYDLEPSMSAYALTSAVSDQVVNSGPDFVCLNYANADMVGHTGVFAAAKAACEAVDACLSTLVPLLLNEGYKMLIIADHGNSDYMINPDGSPHTAHTTNPVPCIYIADDFSRISIADGKLADIAPTILSMMGISIPKTMTGAVLIDS